MILVGISLLTRGYLCVCVCVCVCIDTDIFYMCEHKYSKYIYVIKYNCHLLNFLILLLILRLQLGEGLHISI